MTPDRPFFYRCHGLEIASQFELAELKPLLARPSAAPDITIDLGPTPVRLDGANSEVDDYQVSKEEILLTIPAVGRYWARNGRSLTVEPAPDVDAGALQLYLLGSALGAILYQRGFVPLHACAFSFEGTCVAVLGDSGAGKSTLGAMLSRRGFLLVSDDVLALRKTKDCVLLGEPSLPLLKLWPRSLEVAGLSGEKAPYECVDYNKHRLTVPERFTSDSLPLKRFYVLRWLADPANGSTIRPLSGLDALMALRANVYRPALIGAMGREQSFFEDATRLLAQARPFEFQRAMDLGQAEAQIDTFVRHLRQS